METKKTETDLLAPLEIWEVLLDNSSIKFHKPLVLVPEILPPEEPGDKTFLTVDIPELNISAHGVDREELIECVQSCVNFCWRHYVQPEDEQLSSRIREIKRNYLAVAEEVVDG